MLACDKSGIFPLYKDILANETQNLLILDYAKLCKDT